MAQYALLRPYSSCTVYINCTSQAKANDLLYTTAINHYYADDTQLYVALSPNSMHVVALESCLESLQAWSCANSMTLNADKSNVILFATSRRAQSLFNQVSVNISGVTIPLSNHVKILGVVLDPRITLSEHTKAISKSCFYHIRALKHIRDSLDSSRSVLSLLPLSPLG